MPNQPQPLGEYVREIVTGPESPLYLVTKAADPNENVAHLQEMTTACGPIISGHSNVEIITLCGGSHRLDPDAATYIDGVIASTCLNCGERFEIRWLPGGTGALELRFVAERILGYLDAGSDPPPALVQQLLDAHAHVIADRELIEDSLALYQTLRRVLER